MQNIDSDLIRGNIDTIILKTMLNEDKYGLDIIKEVSDKSSGTYELKQPTLYSCLKRLENQALISSYWVDSEIGGKRHYYKLTDKGRDFYNKKQEEWARSKFIIDNLLSNYDYEEYRLVKKDEYGEILERQANAPLYANPNPAEQENEQNYNHPDAENVSDKVEPGDDINANETNSEENEINYEFAGEENSDETGTNDELDNSTDNLDYYQNNDSEENSNGEDYNEEELSKLEQFLSKPENSSDDDVFEFSETNSNEDFENEDFSFDNNSSDDDYPVYFEAKPQENNEKQDYVSYETHDESSNELNLLSRLRDQEDETINTYYGDQKSYVNHLRNLDESQVEQQDLLDSSLYARPDEVNKSIDEFADAIEKLNNFDSSASSSNEIEEEPINELEENTLEEEYDEPYSPYEETSKDEYDELSELESIKNISSNKFFDSEDTDGYDKIDSQKNSYDEPDDFEFEYKPEEKSSMTFEEIANEIKPLESESQQSEYYENNYEDNGLAIDTPDDYGENEKYEEPVEDNMSQIDSIITKNITAEFTEPTPVFYTNSQVSYREKLSNLSKYSRVSLDDEEDKKDNAEAIEKAKDIAEITKELEEEGIKIREHYAQTNSKKLDRNYLLSNKINLVKSLILLFGYVFILSATYIILNNTPLGKNSWFSITPFLIGLIPFGVYALCYLIMFAVNPYKKIDAKFYFRIMLFISVIIAVQLLLITYCVNLQLGFYSFTQKEYNHLYWIIPSIISFAPIIDNFIYLSLFKSRNFNV